MSIFYLILLFPLFSLLLIATTISAQPYTDPTDTFALKAFKTAIKPSSIPSYACLSSWNFSTDPCTVPHYTSFICGLTCASNRVNQITLDPAGYSGVLTPFVAKLTQLVTLDLSNNNFYGPIPTAIFNLPNLITLTLRSNSFSGYVPPSISNLKSLISLDISHNSLTGVLPNTLSALDSLTLLDLSYNKITGSIPKLPPNTLELALKSNYLSGYLPELSFAGLTQLEVVELSQNSLSGTLKPWFFLIPTLQQVDLANNNFTTIDISKPVDPNTNLIAIDLSYNQISGYVPLNFTFYPSLSSLTLSHNRLRGPIPIEFSQKQTLKRLYLDGNFLNGSPPVGLFAGNLIAGSLGDNCLNSCPVSSPLCSQSQKPHAICQQAYGGKKKT